jgi:hypothetical protein
MANISPTIMVDIFVTPNVTKNILLGVTCSLRRFKLTKDFSKIFVMCFVSRIWKFLDLIQELLSITLKHGKTHPLFGKQMASPSHQSSGH